jgi:4-hydroxy-tetrahydrodipicolinate synthase
MKSAAQKFQGVSAFIVTPTKDDGEALDLSALKRFIDFQIDSGVDGITVFGSTGGIGSFGEQERQQVIETAARHINGRVVLTAGTGAIQTAEAVRLSKFAADAGADGVLVVPINYWRLNDDELYGHYESIATSVSIPVGIYNNPGTTGIDMSPALISRIAEIDNIGFVKESSGDVTRISAIAQKTKGSISILNGNDAGTPAAIAAGVNGWFAGSCSIMPKLCTNLFALRQGDRGMEKMRQAFATMYPICEFMGIKGYIRVAYAACDILGHSMGAPRKPVRSLNKADRLILERLLTNAGLTVTEAAA